MSRLTGKGHGQAAALQMSVRGPCRALLLAVRSPLEGPVVPSRSANRCPFVDLSLPS
jgi:hypothetical protein